MPSCLAVSSANQISGWIYTVVPWKSAFVPLVSPFIFVARHSYRIRQSMRENRLVDIFVFMSATTLCSFFFVVFLIHRSRRIRQWEVENIHFHFAGVVYDEWILERCTSPDIEWK